MVQLQQLKKKLSITHTFNLLDMYLPKDPEILYSMINMKLRDTYSSLEDFCADEDVDREEIEQILNSAGYYYNEENNSFR